MLRAMSLAVILAAAVLTAGAPTGPHRALEGTDGASRSLRRGEGKKRGGGGGGKGGGGGGAGVAANSTSPCCWSFNAETKRWQYYVQPAGADCVAPYKPAACQTAAPKPGAPAAKAGAASPTPAAAAEKAGAAAKPPAHAAAASRIRTLPPPPPRPAIAQEAVEDAGAVSSSGGPKGGKN